LLTATIRVADPKPERDPGTPSSIAREAKAGLSWVYVHRMLKPLALGTHGWFFFSSILATVYVPFVLLTLSLSAFAVGVTFGLAGLGALLGSSFSTRISRRIGISPTISGSRLLEAGGFALIAVAPAVTDPALEWAT